MKETEVQRQIISQLKNLTKNHTKPLCSLGHRWCRIDHHKYNIVKSYAVVEPPPTKNNKALMDKTCQLSDQKIRKLCRKIDLLQSSYGVPPSHRKDTTDDLITAELAAIWDNVYFFPA